MSDLPVTIIVHFRAKAGQADALRTFLSPAILRLSKLPSCRGGSLYSDADDPDLLVLVEHWDSAQAHKSYLDDMESQGKMGELRELLAEAPQRRYLNATA